jgi:hypothetical protein
MKLLLMQSVKCAYNNYYWLFVHYVLLLVGHNHQKGPKIHEYQDHKSKAIFLA